MGPPASHAFHQRILFAALVVHVVTAWFSSGYYAADEHYQIIAFAQARLGELSIADLPWEFEARMRSGFLPGIAYVVIGTCRKLITTDPFIITFLLRLITALFALVVVRAFVRAALAQVSDQLHQPFILLSYFLWFLPYQHVRFAAETWSGLLFLLGLSVFLGGSLRNRSWLIAGLCFGLCVQMKPAMIVACGGAMCWALSRSDAWGRSFVRLASGGVIAMAFGALADSWFYGEPMHTLWSYVYKNSLSISKVHPLPVASETYPWWYYFPWIIKYGIWPIGAALVAGLFWLTYRTPRALLVWCIWPYLLLVSAIPHKELRFLFPLVDLAPLVLVLAWQELGPTFAAPREGLKRRLLLSCAALMTVLNTTGLVVASTSAAGSGRTTLAGTIGRLRDHPATLGYGFHEPEIWQIRIPEFYLPDALEDVGFFDPCWTPSVLSGPEATTLLIARENDPSGSGCVPEYGGYKRIGGSESGWASEVLNLYNSERHGPFLLYQLEHEQ